MNYSDYRKQVQSILANAGFYKGEIDGRFGNQTIGSFHDLAYAQNVAATDNPTSPAVAPEAGSGSATLSNLQFPPADQRSETNIATLHPRVRPLARALVNAVREQGIAIKVTSGTRTYAEQDALYEQGRTKPGSIVTNARGGYSNHNFGVAFDVTIFVGSSPKWDGPE